MPRATTCKVGREVVTVAEAIRRRRANRSFVGQCGECGKMFVSMRQAKMGRWQDISSIISAT